MAMYLNLIIGRHEIRNGKALGGIQFSFCSQRRHSTYPKCVRSMVRSPGFLYWTWYSWQLARDINTYTQRVLVLKCTNYNHLRSKEKNEKYRDHKLLTTTKMLDYLLINILLIAYISKKYNFMHDSPE